MILAAELILQCLWASLLVLPRTRLRNAAMGLEQYGNLYSNLLDYVVFAVLIFYVLTIAGFVAYVIACSPGGMRIQSGPLRSTVETTAGFMPAFEAARASGQPAILHLKIDPQAITPATTLDAIRTKALAEHGG